jgi:putative ABC transport system permease protein
MNIGESVILAFDSIRVNKLRAFLTLLSIAIGVFAIVGAGTLVSSLEGMITQQLADVGETSFWIQRMPKIQRMGEGRSRRKPITYTQYKQFKRLMTSTDWISAYSFTQGMTVKNGNLSTDQDVNLIGCEEYFFIINGTNIVEGRPFTEDDITSNRNVAIIGNDVITKIFPNQNPLGKYLTVGSQSYEIIGVLEAKGATFGQSQDNKIVIPLTKFLTYHANEFEQSLDISIKAYKKELLSSTIDDAYGAMRVARNIKPGEENTFDLDTNDTITDQFSGFMTFISVFGFFSGFIALIAAGIGITNIMLVSVKERTREIGIRKAVGAKKRWIMNQFFIETITICQVGGLFGILLGLAGAGILSSAVGLKIVFPITWVVFSIVICTILGLVAGVYPAMKAANLDPIEALRYE